MCSMHLKDNDLVLMAWSAFQKQIEEYIVDCYDSIAVFLSVHIVFRYRSIMAKRSIPALDRWVLGLCNTILMNTAIPY